MEVAFRPFRPDDWDGVFQLDRACFQPPYRLEYPRLRALIEDPGMTVMVIEARQGEETAIVGSLMAKHEAQAGRLVLIGIMVDPEFRLAGLGRRLAGWAERIARARSLGELLAPLEADNEAGAAFLAALGFTREPGVPPFFDDPAGGNLWRRRLPAQASAAATTTGVLSPLDEASVQPVPAPSALAAPAPAPAAPQPETRALAEPEGEPMRPAQRGVSEEASRAAADLPQAGATSGAARDGARVRPPAQAHAGPKSKARPRHAASAESSRKGQPTAGRKRRRT